MEPDILIDLLTFLGTLAGAYLVFRGQIAKVQADASAEKEKLRAEVERLKTERDEAARDDRRDDFKAITDSQSAQIKELQETVRYLRAQILELTRENGGLREKVGEVELRLARREFCPLAQEGKCPLGLVAVAVGAKE